MKTKIYNSFKMAFMCLIILIVPMGVFADALPSLCNEFDGNTVDMYYGINFDDFEEINAMLAEIGNAAMRTRTTFFNQVPLLLQGDARWGGHSLNGCAGTTIRTHGCALVSVTMAHRFYGGTMNPDDVNRTLGSSACPINWQGAADRLNMRVITAHRWMDANSATSIIIGAISQGHTPIIRLNRGGTDHFVVAHGFSGNTIFIRDPANQHTTLGSHLSTHTFSSFIVYGGRLPSNWCNPWGQCLMSIDLPDEK